MAGSDSKPPSIPRGGRSDRGARRRADRLAHFLLAAPWAHFLAGLATFYATAASLFGLLLHGVSSDGSGPRRSFVDALLASMQALTVFGCGRLSPDTTAAKAVLACAVFVGWLALLLFLALLMVRFIRLRAFWQLDGAAVRPHGAEASESASQLLQLLRSERSASRRPEDVN